MKYVKDICSAEHQKEIADVVRSCFGEDFSPKYVEEWCQIIVGEADSCYEDYYIDLRESGELVFGQNGEKEYYHDGSSEPCKYVRIKAIDQQEYNSAKEKQWDISGIYTSYQKHWYKRGEERFFTRWAGRTYDYIYYAKNLSGIPFVEIKIERWS